MRFHVVDSVKGGSGKSTFSLQLAATLEAADSDAAEPIKPVIVDVDLLGTSWYTLYGNSIENQTGRNFVFLHDLIDDFDRCKKRRFIYRLPFHRIAPSPNPNGSTDIILCSPDDSVKRRFKAANAGGYVREIHYSQFRYTLLKLINYLRDHGYTDVIFDMPPNSDSYSDQVFDVILDVGESKGYRENDKAFLYMISAYNRAHIQANWTWLQEFYRTPLSLKWNMGRIQPFFLLNLTVALSEAMLAAVIPVLPAGSKNQSSELLQQALAGIVRDFPAMPDRLLLSIQEHEDSIAIDVFKRAFISDCNNAAETVSLAGLNLYELRVDPHTGLLDDSPYSVTFPRIWF